MFTVPGLENFIVSSFSRVWPQAMCLGDSVPLGSIMIMGSHPFGAWVWFLSDKPILHTFEPKILEKVECSLPKGQATLVSWGTRPSLSLKWRKKASPLPLPGWFLCSEECLPHQRTQLPSVLTGLSSGRSSDRGTGWGQGIPPTTSHCPHPSSKVVQAFTQHFPGSIAYITHGLVSASPPP